MFLIQEVPTDLVLTVTREEEFLAEVLERNERVVAERWLSEVRADARLAQVEPTELEFAIGGYIKALAVELRAGASSPRGPSAWQQVAQKHALTRVRLGFDVEELVHELMVFRRVVIGLLQGQGHSREAGPVQIIAALVDNAVAASVKSYVEARNYAFRQQEAVHLGFLAHELQTPLSNTSLALYNLRRVLAPRDDANDLLERAERNIARMSSVVDDALALGTLESGTVQPALAEVLLHNVIRDILPFFEQAAKNKGLGFEVNLNPTIFVRTDLKLVQTALEQLLGNAIKYTDQGSISFSVQQEGGALSFHVRDSCPGLSSEELSIIFEPFRRGRSSKQGTGLGLAVARRAVLAIGGEIHAESTGERGCHFWFSIPAPASN